MLGRRVACARRESWRRIGNTDCYVLVLRR
jgi:hypothetical protein